MPDRHKASWRGEGKDKTSVARHRWQESQIDDPRYQRKKLWYRLKIGILVVLSLALIGAFIILMNIFEPWPGLIAISVTRYDWPIPPNSQAKEDHDNLLALDKQTLRVAGMHDSWNTGDKDAMPLDRAQKQLNDQLEQFWRSKRSYFRQSRQVMIVYLSLHGAVNRQGEPCLLLPHAPALNSQAWLPLSDVLEAINKRIPGPVRKLLVLDCTRMLTEWNLGLLYNGFSEGLQGVVDDVNVPNLVVLNATSAGQSAWTSPLPSFGSVFGHYFQLGLAGAADGISTPAKDGVTLDELTKYLEGQVRQWVAENRADEQVPALIRPTNQEIKDFKIARPAPGLLDRILSGNKAATTSEQDRREHAVSNLAEEIGGLWVRHQELRARPAYRMEPLKWEKFEQKLIWLEQLSWAGTAYQEDYQNALREVRKLSEELEKPRFVPPPLSLPLAKYGGELSEYLQVVEDEWKRLQDDPAVRTLESGLKRINEFSVAAEDPIELHFMRMLQRHLDAGWKAGATTIAPIVGRAVRLRQLAEEVTTPADERVHPWVRKAVETADPLRRDAEDQLFLGRDSNSGVEADRILKKAESDAQYVGEALAARDQAFAELPYWAEWLARPGRPDTTEKSGADPRTRADFLALIRRVNALTDDLGRPGADRADIAAIHDVATEIRQELRRFASELQRYGNGLLDPSRQDAANLREIADVLATPLVSGDLRKSLLRAYAQLLSDPPKAGATIRPAAERATRGYRERLQDWEEHPALVLLQTKSSSSSDSMDRKCEQIREMLSADVVREIGDRISKNSPIPASEADALARRVAVLKADWREVKDDPAQFLRAHDLFDLVSWQYRRTLDDFWGPGKNDSAPYFYLATAKYKSWVDTELKKDLSDLSTLRANRIAAAQNGFSIESKSLAVIDDDEEEEYAHAAAVTRDKNLPAGTAAYVVRARSAGSSDIPVTTGRGKVPSQRLSVPIPGDSDPLRLNYFLPKRELQKYGESLQAQVLFRGHLFGKDIRYLPDKGSVVNYVRPIYSDPQVIVHGPADRGAVMFVFDCSASMKNGTPQRMGVAKTALNETLRKLADRSQAAQGGVYQVGAIFYGHRMGELDNERPLNTNYHAKIRALGLPVTQPRSPGEDTELLLPIVPFKNLDQPDVKNIFSYLESVSPWGITPLYPALIKAADELGKVDTLNKRIIAITDGMDYQGKSDGERHKRKEHVIAACRGIPIYFVGFDMERAEEERADKEFGAIVRECKGDFLKAKNTNDLVTRLEQSLDLRHYIVRSSENLPVTQPRDVDKEQTILRKAQVEEYVVEVQAANPEDNIRTPSMRLEGGEHIKMRVAKTGIEFEGCEDDAFAHVEVRERQNPGDRFDVKVLRPERIDNAVQFSICVENSDPAKFSPRPVEIWLTVTPITNDPASNKGAYIFYDRAFESRTSTPVMRFLAEQWPVGAEDARLELWCKFRRKTPIEQSKTFTVGRFSTGLPEKVQFGNAAVEVEVETMQPGKDGMLRVVVTEIHQDRWNPLKVEIDSSPQPNIKKAVHRFSDANKAAKHTFYFENIRDPRDAADFRVILTPQSAVKDEAMSSGPISVKVR
jgi:hypothetical protein